MAFNDLTNAQEERLHMLIEEAGEVIQACTKILRHGYKSTNRGKLKRSNKQELERELGQMWGIARTMSLLQDFDMGIVLNYSSNAWDEKRE